MITNEDLEASFKEQYKNGKSARSLSINKELFIDCKILCEELSRKSNKKITVSSTVRLFLYKFLLDNGRLELKT